MTHHSNGLGELTSNPMELVHIRAFDDVASEAGFLADLAHFCFYKLRMRLVTL